MVKAGKYENIITPVELAEIKFKVNSKEMVASEERKLHKLLENFSDYEGHTFTVNGYTAAAGSEQERINLSGLRAKEVIDSLAGLGFDRSRFILQELGSAEPKRGNKTAEEMAENRRVLILINPK